MPPVDLAKVIINVRSGFNDKEKVRRQLTEIFDSADVKADISIAKSGAELAKLARSAAQSNFPVIVAGGGDGTINLVASALIESGKTLGVLPLGTLNHFAKDLKIPLDLEAAVRTIVAGHCTNVDVGEVNGQIFLNNSSLGLYPVIVHERLKKQRLGSGKWPAFVWAAATALRRYPFLRVHLIAQTNEFDLKTPFVFVGNNEYAMEMFNIGRREHLDRGLLSVYVTNRLGRLGLVRLAFRALFGRLREDRDFLALTTDQSKIKTRHKRLRVAFDGEVEIMNTPLRYRVRPRALSVIVPR